MRYYTNNYYQFSSAEYRTVWTALYVYQFILNSLYIPILQVLYSVHCTVKEQAFLFFSFSDRFFLNFIPVSTLLLFIYSPKNYYFNYLTSLTFDHFLRQRKQRQPTSSESVQCQTEERRRGEGGAARDTPGYIGGYTCNGGHAPEDNSALYPDFARSLLSLSSLKKLPCLYCKKWIVVSVLLCMNTVHGVHGVSWFWQFPRF